MIKGFVRLKQLAYPWRIGIAFCIATSGVLAGMIWMTIQVLRLERSEAEAKQRAVLEENIRLSLWRIDSALSPLLAQESVRPNSLPSTSPYVKLCFQFAPDGSLSTSSSSLGKIYDPLTQEFAAKVSMDRLLGMLPNEANARPRFTSQTPASQSLSNNNSINRSQLEFEQRRDNVFTSNSVMTNNIPSQGLNGFQNDLSISIGPNELSAVSMAPLSHQGELLLVRRAAYGGRAIAEGCWLDWNAIRTSMLKLVEDLLPSASLEICENIAVEDGSNLLASIPAKLNPGTLLVLPSAGPSATGWLLAMTWIGVLSGLVASAGLVLGSIRLAERRSAFVAAVTHELRTPLTTFLMYTEMLSQGMVPDPKAQKQYISTLRHEALRLEHLVENVLAYAKLERGRTPQPLQRVSVESLLDHALPYLQQRTAMSQMELEVPETPNRHLLVQASPGVVEQILLNLVDNACKYASSSSDRRIQLLFETTDRDVSIGIKDFGPGFPKQVNWFRPFHKTVEEAANSVPGVGLGLSLSKRLAEQMNGSLELKSNNGDGAYVKLVLPICCER